MAGKMILATYKDNQCALEEKGGTQLVILIFRRKEQNGWVLRRRVAYLACQDKVDYYQQ